MLSSTNTDGVLWKIDKDMYEDFHKDKDHFDLCNYSTDTYFY